MELVACCDIREDAAKQFAERHGVPAWYTDPMKLLAKEKLDACCVATSDAGHAPISIAAFKKGLHVLCEKPLATSVAESRRMLAAAKKSGKMNMVNFTYRTFPALERAKELIDEGRIGRPIHVEASYLQSWLCSKGWGDWRTKPALLWRLNRAAGGSGTLGDLGCHILDFASRVAGDISELSCRLARFDKNVPGERLGGYKLDADDSVFVTARFAGGALGTIHTTRWASGHQNSLRLRVYGDRGAVEVDLDRSYETLRVCLGDVARDHAAWTELKLPVRESNMARFLRAVRNGKPESPTFEDGFKIQACLDACLESDRTGRVVAITKR